MHETNNRRNWNKLSDVERMECIIKEIKNCNGGSWRMNDIFDNINYSSDGFGYGISLEGNIDIDGTSIEMEMIIGAWDGNISSTPRSPYPNNKLNDPPWIFYRLDATSNPAKKGVHVMNIYLNDPVTWNEKISGVKTYEKIFEDYIGW